MSSNQQNRLIGGNWPDTIRKRAKQLAYLFQKEPLGKLSLLVAILAFIVSVRSCQLSREANELSVKQYKQDRSLVLAGSFPKDGGISVAPVDSVMRFLEGVAWLPTKLYEKPIPISESGEFYHMGSVTFALEETIERKFPKEEGIAQVSQGGKVPMMIKSFYVARGESYIDISLYFLGMGFLVTDKPYERPKISFESLSFIQRLPFDRPVPIEELDKIFDYEGFHIGPRAP